MLFKPYSKIVTLLLKSLQGIATEDEVAELERWRSSDTENELLYQKINDESFWNDRSQGAAAYQDRLVRGWLKLEKRRKQQKRWKSIRQFAAIAASIVIPLFCILWLLPEKRIPPARVTEATIEPGKAKAELILADGSAIELGTTTASARLEAEGIQLNIQSQNISYSEEKEAGEAEYNTLRIPRGGEYHIVLGDGTKIYLNSESEIRYPLQFGKHERRLEFWGEAYFEVARDESRPFIIESNGTSVEVLGTTFNLRSYQDEEQIATTLVSGQVRFSAGEQSVILNPGEQGIADRAAQVSKQAVNVHDYTAWKDGLFIFRSQRLETIMNRIARWYDVDVVFATASRKDILFSGNIKRYADFSKIIEMLEMPGDIQFEIQGRTITIN